MDHYLCAGQKNIKKKKKDEWDAVYIPTRRNKETHSAQNYTLYTCFSFICLIYHPQFCFLFFSVIFLVPCTPFILVAPLLFKRNFSI